ncbi:MAG: iron ABC transporter permease [Spirochaetales bacterium]
MIQEYFRLEARKRWGAVLLLTAVVAVSLFYLSVGVISISFGEILSLLFGQTRVENPVHRVTLFSIRLPRLIAALMVGSGLALSGATYQSLFQNRLADPFTTGVSAGAVLGCTVALILGFNQGVLGLGGLTFFAFLGALGTSVMVFLVLGVLKRASSVTILLIGISLNFFLSAVVSLLLFLHRNRIESIVLWTMGSIATATSEKVLFSLPILGLGGGALFLYARTLDYLFLGEEFARLHGIAVERTRFFLILFASLVASVCVALSGIVGFVGLVTPNMARLLVGSKHRMVLGYSALLGALFFLGSDLLARTLLSPAEIPIGILTSLIGVPVFAALIWKYSRRIY